MSRLLPVGDLLSAAGRPVVVAHPATVHAHPWYPLAEVTSTQFVSGMILNYQRWLGVREPAAGASCATQHYAGRVASWLIGGWALTGSLPGLQDVLAEVDEHGRTLNIVVPPRSDTVWCSGQVALEALQCHMEPVVEVACREGHITPRLAWGGVATSVAGVMLHAAAQVDGEERERLLDDAVGMLAEQAWPVAGPLITLFPHGEGYRRRTCCLMCLSEGHGRCVTCPHDVHTH